MNDDISAADREEIADWQRAIAADEQLDQADRDEAKAKADAITIPLTTDKDCVKSLECIDHTTQGEPKP